MRGKIFKGVLLALIAGLLTTTFAVMPARAQDAWMRIPSMSDVSKGPGATFSTDVTIEEVEHMFGYDFVLAFDTSTLEVVSAVGVSPFNTKWLLQTDNIGGKVVMAYSFPPGELFGKTTSSPIPIATINWKVKAYGLSPWEIYYSTVADVRGNDIYHEVQSGMFSNIGPLPTNPLIALNTGFVEYRHFKISKNPEGINTLTGQFENVGTETTSASVFFTLFDSMGGVMGELRSGWATVAPGEHARVVAYLDVKGLAVPADFYIEARVRYVDATGVHFGMKGSPDAHRTSMTLSFFNDY